MARPHIVDLLTPQDKFYGWEHGKVTISRAESDRVTHNSCKHPIRVALLESIAVDVRESYDRIGRVCQPQAMPPELEAVARRGC